VIWLASEIGLKQLEDALNWPSGNGKNGRTHAKYEFYEGTKSWI
jgi:hypothetical protein